MHGRELLIKESSAMAGVRDDPRGTTPRDAAGSYGMDFSVLPGKANVVVAGRGAAAEADRAIAPVPTGRDLRDYLAFLEQHHPDQLFYVDREVAPRFEVTSLLAKLERQGRYPVVIFRNVRGSKLPVVTNVHASFQRLAMSLGLPGEASVRDFTDEYSRREDRPIQPVL